MGVRFYSWQHGIFPQEGDGPEGQVKFPSIISYRILIRVMAIILV